MAKAHPTSTLIPSPATTKPQAVATSPDASAEVRNARTPLPMRSCESAPDMLISKPEEVDRNAAKAPPAVRAARAAPGAPLATRRGSARTTESV